MRQTSNDLACTFLVSPFSMQMHCTSFDWISISSSPATDNRIFSLSSMAFLFSFGLHYKQECVFLLMYCSCLTIWKPTMFGFWTISFLFQADSTCFNVQLSWIVFYLTCFQTFLWDQLVRQFFLWWWFLHLKLIWYFSKCSVVSWFFYDVAESPRSARQQNQQWAVDLLFTV